MKKTWLMTAAFLVLSPLLHSQDPPHANPALPAEILGPPLVAWSVLQQPHPIPEPSPSLDNRSEGSPSQPAQSPTQSFTGTIAKDHGRYILRISEITAYQIDDQENAQAYEGKQVRITGNFDEKINALRVASIESLS